MPAALCTCGCSQVCCLPPQTPKREKKKREQKKKKKEQKKTAPVCVQAWLCTCGSGFRDDSCGDVPRHICFLLRLLAKLPHPLIADPREDLASRAPNSGPILLRALYRKPPLRDLLFGSSRGSGIAEPWEDPKSRPPKVEAGSCQSRALHPFILIRLRGIRV